MASLYRRGSTTAQANVNLYCAQCESQIGIFDNEWIRLTSSYARSKDKGTHFGTEVGHRTQVVPSGPAQRSAEGCVMAEVFCRKCSNMVGQYCKCAPDAEKQSLVDQYFYKLSRTFLKDSRSNGRVDPVFGYGSDIVKPVSSRSSIMPRSSMAPKSRWADTPLRQSSRTPAVSAQDMTGNPKRRESQEAPLAMMELVDDKWEQTSAKLQKMQGEMTLQRFEIKEQSDKISLQTTRLDEQETRIQDQDTSIADHESCLSAQATRIVEQDETIKDQTKRLQEQQLQLSKITNQLIKLQKTMDNLKTTLTEARLSSSTSNLAIAHYTGSGGNLETIVDAVKNAQNSTEELQTLRTENQAMKSRLSTIADVVGTTTEASCSEKANADGSLSTIPSVNQTLGKRKRDEAGRPLSLELGGSAVPCGNVVVGFETNAEQMPTPQSSDGGQQSPMQTPSTLNRANGKQKVITRSRNTKTGEHAANQNAGVDAQKSQPRNECEDITSNNAGYFPQATPARTSLQQPPDLWSESSLGVRAMRTRNGPATTTANKKGRSSMSRCTLEVENSDDDSSIMQSSHVASRRVTRASTKAVQPIDVDADPKARTVEPVLQPSSSLSLPLQIDEERNLLKSLPTVQMASSVLGMNLEALIASSQALRQGLNFQRVVSDPQPSTSPSPRVLTVQNQHEPGPIELASQPDFQANNTALTSNQDITDHEYGRIDFIQDTGIDNIIDTSDDDDDDLMQPNTALYGDDSLDTETVSLPEWEDIDAGPLASSELSQRVTGTTIIRQDRSMAPEPYKPKKSITVRRGHATLDRMHMITPAMFATAYAAGLKPKLTRPPAVQARERDLNEELMQLGLSEWVGKNKNCKEYRQAVAAARARFRNFNKAAYLWSRGLNHNLSEPSSTLPGVQAPCPESNAQNMPLSNIEDVPAPVPRASNSPYDEDDDARDEQEISKEQPRATRARTRKSSIPLVSGLEDVESCTAETDARQAPRKRKSDGKGKSQRKSEITSDTDERHIDANLSVSDENIVTDSQLSTNDTTLPMTGDERDVKRRKPSGKSRGRPRKSVVSEPPPTANVEQSGELYDHVIGLLEAPTASVQAPATSNPKFITGHTMGVKAKEIVSPKSQAQRREEAILVRDRMAKELMEREDMEM